MAAPVRPCTICDQEDDHPRHVWDLGGGNTSLRHMDCCAAQGCDLCARQRRGAEDLRGDDLRAHLTTQED